MTGNGSHSRLTELLVENQSLRARAAATPQYTARLTALQRWQSDRLAATYADFSATPRYRAAVDFFLHDLYGPHDFADRDADLLRVHKVMERMLPARAREALTHAVELEVLSQRLDLAIADELESGSITPPLYAEAYRRAGMHAERRRQIELIETSGRYLDELVARPMIRHLIKLVRGPVHAAGFGALQAFLERGFDAFRTMGGADEFLSAVVRRETAIMERLLAGTPAPFAIDEIEPGATR